MVLLLGAAVMNAATKLAYACPGGDKGALSLYFVF